MAKKLKSKRLPKIKPINNFALLFFLSVFQILTSICAGKRQDDDYKIVVVYAMLLFVVTEWAYLVFFFSALHRRNFELEFIAFFLCGTGIATIGSINANAAMKQYFMILAGIFVYIFMVFLLGNVELCMKLRTPVAILAIALLIFTLIFAKNINGARNWIIIGPKDGGISIQPSEFVKVAFIFVGAATLEKIQTSKNIFAFIGFAIACVGSLILMKDMGTALVFFITFLIIAFMNSGDIKTVILAIASGGLGAGIYLKYKSYAKARFAVYRHVFDKEFYNGSGFQASRTLVGLASGGLLGLGIGNGNTRNVAYSSTDLIFGVICEEWGFIFGIILVLTFVAIAVSAIVNSVAARSTFYSIAAVAAAGMLLFQTALNIFGITDVLPLTGVTLPFVSGGGSSMICCWGALAFIKASDVRTYNYLGGAKK